jgi:hypothetical protein
MQTGSGARVAPFDVLRTGRWPIVEDQFTHPPLSLDGRSAGERLPAIASSDAAHRLRLPIDLHVQQRRSARGQRALGTGSLGTVRIIIDLCATDRLAMRSVPRCVSAAKSGFMRGPFPTRAAG